MTDREALAAALEEFNAEGISIGEFVIFAAARKYLAQLPEKCQHGLYDGHHVAPSPDTRWCPGKQYPPALVERIARAYMDYNYGSDVAVTDADRGFAVAVLDALNGETSMTAPASQRRYE